MKVKQYSKANGRGQCASRKRQMIVVGILLLLNATAQAIPSGVLDAQDNERALIEAAMKCAEAADAPMLIKALHRYIADIQENVEWCKHYGYGSQNPKPDVRKHFEDAGAEYEAQIQWAKQAINQQERKP
jgi:hypothetical protein